LADLKDGILELNGGTLNIIPIDINAHTAEDLFDNIENDSQLLLNLGVVSSCPAKVENLVALLRHPVKEGRQLRIGISHSPPKVNSDSQ